MTKSGISWFQTLRPTNMRMLSYKHFITDNAEEKHLLISEKTATALPKYSFGDYCHLGVTWEWPSAITRLFNQQPCMSTENRLGQTAPSVSCFHIILVFAPANSHEQLQQPLWFATRLQRNPIYRHRLQPSTDRSSWSARRAGSHTRPAHLPLCIL